MSSNIPLEKQDIPQSERASSDGEIALSLTNFEGKKMCARCLQGFSEDTPFKKATRTPKHPSESPIVQMCIPCFDHAHAKSKARSQMRNAGKYSFI